MFNIITTGSPNRRHIDRLAATGAHGAAAAARQCLTQIAAVDELHIDEANRALEFWTIEQIVEDLMTAGSCAINVCGGYYCVEVS